MDSNKLEARIDCKLYRLFCWGKKYSIDTNELYCIVRTIKGTIGIYCYDDIPEYSTILYDVYHNEVHKHR